MITQVCIVNEVAASSMIIVSPGIS